MFITYRFYYVCSLVSQLQLHDGGVKIHEIIYEQVRFWVV